jgi:hypothetical protein
MHESPSLPSQNWLTWESLETANATKDFQRLNQNDIENAKSN